MDARVLDKRTDDRGTCFLCKATLSSYIASLPDTYQQYDIQREIVTNVYLDRLVETVLRRRHIPPIVLVVEQAGYTLEADEATLRLTTYRILDGLQRTHRLKAIQKTIEFFEGQVGDVQDVLTLTKYQLSRKFGSALCQ